MGMKLFGNCTNTPYTSQEAKAPNPVLFTIRHIEQIKCCTLALVHYPHCTNFEGEKILLYKDTIVSQVKSLVKLDPHFAEGGRAPFARFTPTEDGWNAAVALAHIL